MNPKESLKTPPPVGGSGVPYIGDIQFNTESERFVTIKKSSSCGFTETRGHLRGIPPDIIKLAEASRSVVKGGGMRHNDGKPRYDLEPAFARKQYIQVLTKGSLKYAERNWEKGMSWNKVIASLERHIAAIKLGEDRDFDPSCEGCKSGYCVNHTGELHSALAMCNAAFLTEYYKIYPQGDDRPHTYLNRPKIGLDIDEVICDWIGPWCKLFGHETPNSWNFSYQNRERLNNSNPDELNTFYANLPAKISPSDLPFEPHCYITSRSIDPLLTQRWIEERGFPTAKVYSVGFGESKVDAALKSGVDIFVDDNFEHFVALNNAGVCTYLMDAPHNRKYNVGHKRIKSLSELV